LPFTTEPKTRSKAKFPTISLNRSIAFMQHCYEKGLKEASYKTIKYEFEEYWPGCDQRSIIKYIGQPEIKIHYGPSTVVRQDVSKGSTSAVFHYLNDRTIQEKKGLLEIIGYVTRLPTGKGLEARFKFNYENFTFNKEQVPLVQEASEASKDNFSVSSIETEASLIDVKDSMAGSLKNQRGPFLRGNDNGGEEKKEEEAIDSTHKSSPKIYGEWSLQSSKDSSVYTNLETAMQPLIICPLCGANGRKVVFASEGDLRNHCEVYHGKT
jgi:hypothetical protein